MTALAAPARFAVVVAPSDTVDLVTASRALYVGSAGGNISVQMNGNTVIFTAVPIGILPIQCTRVNLTGTTSTNIVSLW